MSALNYGILRLVIGVASFAAFEARPARQALSVEVLAIVADRVVSDRQVIIGQILKRPTLYRGGLKASDFPKSSFEAALQEHIVELMILEDNRLIGRETAPEAELKRAEQRFRRQIGDRYRAFLQEFELSDADVRAQLGQRIVVDRILDARIEAAAESSARSQAGKALSAAEKESIGRKALDDWIGQLRARYRVQRLSVDPKVAGAREAPRL